MNQLVVAKQGVDVRDAGVIEAIFRLRHEAFRERLKWDVESDNGVERDYFDDLEPRYIAVRGGSGRVDGCWRALPTEGDYMLKSIFPELLQGENAPIDKSVWEISRFAVRKGSAMPQCGVISSVTLDLVKSFYSFAKDNDIKNYVTVTTVPCERILRQLGVECWRMGKGRTVQVGKERSIALWINANKSLKAVEH